MSIIDYIKGLFGGKPKEDVNQSANVVEDESANSDCAVDKTPNMVNVARFVIQKGYVRVQTSKGISK